LSNYVKLDPSATEQTIRSSIGTLSKGVITLWRNSGDYYTFLGFSNGTTETYLGGIGFKSQSDTNLYHKIGGSYYKFWDENNDGSGSGLDADLLDGQHGSYYATASGLTSANTNITTLQGYFTNGVANNANKLNGNTSDWYMKRGAAYTLNNNGTCWQKVATCTRTGTGTHDAAATLIVSDYYYKKNNGILVLTCRKESGASIYSDYTKAFWIARDKDIVLDNYVLTFKYNSSTNTSIWSLYVKQAGTWQNVRFTMIDEGRWEGKLNLWTLLTATGTNDNSYSAIPSDESQIGSVDYSAASQLVTTRTIWGQNFNGTDDVSGAITGATTISASSNVSVGGTLDVTGTFRARGSSYIGTLGPDGNVVSGTRLHVYGDAYIGSAGSSGVGNSTLKVYGGIIVNGGTSTH